jgi:hypothetical protein
MSEIFIASSSIDKPTYGRVAEKLAERGLSVFEYLADKVASGEDSFSVSITRSGNLNFIYNGETKDLSAISAGWYRHTNLLGLEQPDKAKQISLEDEVNSLQDIWWHEIKNSLWLNSPDNIQRTQSKLAQLAVATSLGFNVPLTIISNNWDSLNEYLEGEDMIVKMARGVLFDKNQTKVLYTTRLTSESLQNIRTAMPFPGIFQNYIPKSREWRITVVRDDIFEASIYTADDAKDDWRRHQLTSRVTFKKESIGADIKDKCIKFLGHYGLGYGAFDFIESDDGQITFLECNPNGQFIWLEDLLDLQISDAIVGELVKISNQ